VKDNVAAGNRSIKGRCVTHVALDQVDIVEHIGQAPVAACPKVVNHRHFVATRQEGMHEVVADETGAAGNEHLHAAAAGCAG